MVVEFLVQQHYVNLFRRKAGPIYPRLLKIFTTQSLRLLSLVNIALRVRIGKDTTRLSGAILGMPFNLYYNYAARLRHRRASNPYIPSNASRVQSNLKV